MTLLAIGAAALLLTVSIVLFARFVGAGLADGSEATSWNSTTATSWFGY